MRARGRVFGVVVVCVCVWVVVVAHYSMIASILPFLCARVWTPAQGCVSLPPRAHSAGSRSPRVPTCVPDPQRARPLKSGGVDAEEVGKPQAGDLLHLAQGDAQLLRRRAVQPARQLARYGRPVAEARGEHEGEAETRAVLRVELLQPEPLVGAQARQARAALLALRLGSQRALLQLAARQVRVAAQDALLACGEAQTSGRSALPRRGQGARASGGKRGPQEVMRVNEECPGGAGRPLHPPLKYAPKLVPLCPRCFRPQPEFRGGAGSDRFVL